MIEEGNLPTHLRIASATGHGASPAGRHLRQLRPEGKLHKYVLQHSNYKSNLATELLTYTIMKKTAGFLLIFLSAIFCGQAQNVIKPAKQKADSTPKKMVVVKTLPQVNTNIAVAPDIIIFEKPNYTGDSAGIIKKADGTYQLPFPLQHVSFKVPNGKIVYIKRCFEFGSEKAYFKSQPDINLADICGFRTDETTKISVTFNGISSEIHNSDCMRFSGTVKVKILETAPDNSTADAVMMYSHPTGDGRSISTQGEAPIFDWGNGRRASLYDVSQNNGTIYNNNPVPELKYPAHNRFGLTEASYKVTYTVGKSALRDGRLR
ncbi:MAG: hypothetical protein ABI666_04730, partial [Ferruginibacter sp.]